MMSVVTLQNKMPCERFSVVLIVCCLVASLHAQNYCNRMCLHVCSRHLQWMYEGIDPESNFCGNCE